MRRLACAQVEVSLGRRIAKHVICNRRPLFSSSCTKETEFEDITFQKEDTAPALALAPHSLFIGFHGFASGDSSSVACFLVDIRVQSNTTHSPRRSEVVFQSCRWNVGTADNQA